MLQVRPPSSLNLLYRRARNQQHHYRHFSWKSQAEGTSTTVDDASKLDLLSCIAKKTTPPLLFPWRHEPDPPPRLVEREADFATNQPMSYGTSTMVISALTGRAYLKVPLLRLLGSGWSRELADSCSWAFAQSVAGILSNEYVVPMANIASLDDDGDIALDFTYNPSTTQEQGKNASIAKDAANNDKKSSMDDDGSSMMEAKLRNIFSSAHKSGRDQIEIHLATKPTGAHLHSLHALPALSRSLAEDHPTILKEIEEAKSKRDKEFLGGNYVQRVMAQTGDDAINTTMFAEVLVYCDEVFRVRNLETGAIVQGYEDGKVRQVVHGVRLERVVRSAPGAKRTLSNWLITDIDDLLDGNRWYAPAGVPWFHSG